MDRTDIDITRMKTYVKGMIKGMTLDESLEALDREVMDVRMVGSMDSVFIADALISMIPYIYNVKREEGLMNLSEYLESLTTEQLRDEVKILVETMYKEASKQDTDNSYVDKLKISIAQRRILLEARGDDYLVPENPRLKLVNFKSRPKPTANIEKLMSEGNYEYAEKMAKKMGAVELTLVGNKYLELKNEKKAEEMFRKAKHINGEFVPAYLNLVSLLVSTDNDRHDFKTRNEEALELIDFVSVNVPDYEQFKEKFDAYKNAALNNLGENEKVLDNIKAKIESGKAKIDDYIIYSAMLLKDGKSKEAIAVYGDIFLMNIGRATRVMFQETISRIDDREALLSTLKLPLDNVISAFEGLREKSPIYSELLAEAYYRKALNTNDQDCVENAIDINPHEIRYRALKLKILKSEMDKYSSNNLEAIQKGDAIVLNKIREYMNEVNTENSAIREMTLGMRSVLARTMPGTKDIKEIQ